MQRGQLLFYVTFKGGTAYLGINNLYRKSAIENEPDESIVNRINEIFIENYT